ncbi:MAG: redoxin domain-containing protein [Desulfobacterales bacterium]
MELEALEAAHAKIRDLGAALAMISPQSQAHSQTFIEEKGLSMELLIDAGNQVAQKYGLVYTVPEDLQKVYKQLGIDVSQYNDDGSWQLPMSARYIIDTDNLIRYAAVNADYTVRPDPSETIAALEKILS